MNFMKKTKVLLVKSRSVVAKNTGATPPLGLLYMAAYLRKTLGAEVMIVDALLEKNPLSSIRRAAREFNPDIAGISALTAEFFLAREMARALKAGNRNLPVIIGGPHASCEPESVLEGGDFDAAVIGEGEETFSELAEIIMEEGPGWKKPGILRRVKGIGFKSEGGAEITLPRPPIEDLDSLPFPDWDLIDYEKFWKKPGMATIGVRPYFTMFTSRGCPYQCVFCHKIFGKKFRARSPENVTEEMKRLIKRGASHIEILDDISNLDKERFNGMLISTIEKNLKPVLSFPNALRADILDETSVDLLKRAGAGEVSVAVETASPRLQKLLKKNLSLDKVSRAIDNLVSGRIFTRGFFMLGLPTETEEEMKETIKFAHDSKLHLALFFTPNPYKNTEMRDMFLRAGKLPEKTEHIDYEYYGSPFNASEVPDGKYRRLYRRAYYGFYFNPFRMWRIARDRPAWSDIPARVFSLFRNTSSFRRLREG